MDINVMSLIGCIIGFIVMAVLTYRGWNIMITSVVAAFVVVLFNSMDIVTSYTDMYLVGMGGFLTSYFGMMLFCAVLAVMYSESGAGTTIALSVAKLCLKDSYSAKTRRHVVIIALIIMSGLLEFAGVGATQVVFVLYPIALSLFKLADIPKKFIVAGILGGCLGFANDLPGSPQPGNVIPMTLLGTKSTAAAIPGVIGAIVEIAAMAILVNILISKDVAKGHHFEYGPKDVEFSDDTARPNIIISLLPMLVLIALFDVIELNINIALMLSCVFTAILFRKWFPNKDIKEVVTKGCITSLPATISICAVIGFSKVVQSTVGFNNIVDSLSSMTINPYLLLIIAVAFMCMLCGGSATGQAIAIPIIAPIVNSMGVSLPAIHRIASFAGAILDTMPYAGTVVMAHAFCDVKIKDGYPSVFMISVVATTISTSTVAIICALFPGLAAV